MATRKSVVGAAEAILTDAEAKTFRELNLRVQQGGVKLVAQKIEAIKTLVNELRQLHTDLGLQMDVSSLVYLTRDLAETTDTGWSSSSMHC